MGRRPHPRNAQAQRSPWPRLYGRHAVIAALSNPERVHRKLHITHSAMKQLEAEYDLPKGFNVQFGDDSDLGRLVPADAPHQGMVLEVEPLDSRYLGDFLGDDFGKRPLVVLDQVTDPHNVGAILRSAAAFGAVALVTQDRNSPTESGSLARAASGALELVPWVRVVNLARALGEIGDAGYWRIGLDGAATRNIDDALSDTRPALVFGAEGEGLRHNTAEHCDELAKLPISSKMESLNVSNAAAITLYAAARRL
ncbi:23S rRNA (guanosine(2251)-2'-O)-methyltransferase RlmB [Glacieibacterium sp.]|uniref:23S rRNA (guanosine(2251)-2'-O)-methyltransferase RlmB n=1 Tax=Glacieibacterium sp. TaxID=2860237 RepID=UPI003B00C14F